MLVRSLTLMGQLEGVERKEERMTSGLGPGLDSPSSSEPIKYGELVVLG